MDVTKFKFTAIMMLVLGLSVGANADFADVITQQMEKFIELYNEEKIEDVLDSHTDDLHVMPPGKPKISNKEELRQLLIASTAKYPILSMKNVAVQALCKDHAAQETTFIFSSEDGTETIFGEGVILWAKEVGGWKLRWVIFSPDTPEGVEAAANI